MFEIVDAGLEKMLRAETGLSADQVEIAFSPPDKSWAANVTKPTLNVFLWDIARNPAYASNGFVERLNAEGRLERRSSAPFVDVRYFVTAWSPQQQDEHRLLGVVLRCLLARRTIPAEHFPEGLPSRENITLQFASHELKKPDAFWSAVDGRLRPGVDLAVTLPMDVFAWVETAPEVTTIAASAAPVVPPPATEDERPAVTRRRSGSGMVTEAVR